MKRSREQQRSMSGRSLSTRPMSCLLALLMASQGMAVAQEVDGSNPAPAEAEAPVTEEVLPEELQEELPPEVGESVPVVATPTPEPVTTQIPAATAPPLRQAPKELSGEDAPVDISAAQWQEEYRYLNQLIQRFDQGVEEFNNDVQDAIDQKYDEELTRHQANYDALLEKLREEVSVRRGEAIARYEQFLQRYPNSSKSAIAMVRLAELYYEESQIQFYAQYEAFDQAESAREAGEDVELPPEPVLDYSRALTLYNQVLERFPDYKNIDGVHYVRGFIYNKSDATTHDPEKARDAFMALIESRPDSPHAFQAYLLIGDYYFEKNQLEESISYYSKAMEFRDKPWDQALYKLAWARYRNGEYEEAISRFIELLDYSEDLKARTGNESQVRPEAVQYLAISFADYSAVDEDVVFTFDDAVAYFDEIGGRTYQLEILKKLAEVYQQLARFDDAVFAYNRLQELYPDNPDNPRFQKEIVDIYIALPYGADVDSAMQAKKDLVARYGADSAWYKDTNEALDKQAISYSQRQVQEALQDIAYFYNELALDESLSEAERRRYYDEAGEYYRIYLTRYPFTEDAYEVQYFYAESLYETGRTEEAVKEYRRALTYTNTKHHAASAQAVTFAIGDIIAKQGLRDGLVVPFDEPEEGEALTKVEMDPLIQDYIDAVDTYVRIDREAEDAARFMFIAGRAFHYHRDYEEARRRFEELINQYPGDESSVQAALLTVDGYNKAKNWDAVIETVDGFAGLDLGSDPTDWRKQRDLLIDVQANAYFQKALASFDLPEGIELEEVQAGKEAAAKAFLDYAEKYPDADNRAGALANAALAWEQAGNTDEAIAVRKRIIREHPESEYVEAAYYYIASNYEKAFEFEQAIEYHEELSSKFPNSKNAPISLFNSAFLTLGMRDYPEAAKGFETYVRLYPERDDAESILFMAAETWEKAEEWAQAVRVYREYVTKYPSVNGDKVVMAYHRTIQGLERLGRTREAIEAEKRLAGVYGDLVDKGIVSLRGLNLYAGIRFREVERQFAAFEEIKLQGSEAQLGRQLERKNKAQEELTRIATEVGKLGDQEYRLASLYYVARTYQSYAKAADQLPIPAGLDEFEQEIYQEEVRENFVYPNEENAIGLYEAIVQQSEDLKLSNSWTDLARDQLNVLQPDAYPIRKPERTRGMPADKDFAAPPLKSTASSSQASL